MPRVFISEEGFFGGGYWKLVDPTDDELRERYFDLSFGLATEEDFQKYLKEYREEEAEKLRKRVEASQKAQAKAEKYRAEHPQIKEETPEVSTFKPQTPPKDQSADKRAEYAQKIMFKEQEMDDLGQLERNFENKNDKFLSDANRHFYETEELSQQRNQYPSQQSRFQESVMQDAHGHAKLMADKQRETFQESSRVARIEIEDKIENLHKERNALPW